jgi:acetyltransferase-like isoleucine patch superfamily enzyme
LKRLFEYVLALRYRLNGFLVMVFLRILGCRVGRGLKCLRFPVFRDIPYKNIEIGNRVSFGKGVIFEISETGSLILEDEVVIGDHVKLSSAAKIHMKKWSGIAENSSIRGSFHRLSRKMPYMKQEDRKADILIGEDVLIGANSLILMGSHIPDGVVIGALSLVRDSDKVHPYGIFAGSPLKHIRDRQ